MDDVPPHQGQVGDQTPPHYHGLRADTLLPPSVAIMTCQSPRTSRILRSSHFLVFFSTSVYLSREAELLADLGVAGSVPLLPRYELPPPC